MRLFNVARKRLEEVDSENPPDYAILSHTWGSDEVLYADLQNSFSLPTSKEGWYKLAASCRQTLADGLRYIWIDTCCIDKSSSAELSESINCMFRWYQRSKICYVYLGDVRKPTMDTESFEKCRWFTRGWTLQELLAPTKLNFYDKEWEFLGHRQDLSARISAATGIPKDFVCQNLVLQSASVAQRLSWAATRQTTRLEDQAYCLIGLFGVNMPLLYGEREKAFLRLQEHILRETNDQSLFAWVDPSLPSESWHGLFADSPAQFRDSGTITAMKDWHNLSVTSVTSSMVSVRLPLRRCYDDVFAAALSCSRRGLGQFTHTTLYIQIYIVKLPSQSNQYARIRMAELDYVPEWAKIGNYTNLHVSQRPIKPELGDVNLPDAFVLTRYDNPRVRAVCAIERPKSPYDLPISDSISQSRELVRKKKNLGILTMPGPDDEFAIPRELLQLALGLAFFDSEHQIFIFVLLGSGTLPGVLTSGIVQEHKVAKLVHSRALNPAGLDEAFLILEEMFSSCMGLVQPTVFGDLRVWCDCKFDTPSGNFHVAIDFTNDNKRPESLA